MNITKDNLNDLEQPYTISAIIVIIIFILFAVIMCLNLLFSKHPNWC